MSIIGMLPVFPDIRLIGIPGIVIAAGGVMPG
jgi:hypothetical protein